LPTQIRHLLHSCWILARNTWSSSLGGSLALHATVILALGCLTMSFDESPIGDGVDSRWAALTETIETPLLPPLVKPPKQEQLADSIGGAAHLKHIPQTARRSASVVPRTGDDFLVMSDPALDNSLGETVGDAPISASLSGGNGDGAGAGDGQGLGKGTGFFGMKPKGKTIVYVLDCSQSMNHPHFSEAKTRFRRLKLELIQSIASLPEESSFFIVFFNHEPIPMRAREPQRATLDARKKYLAWMATIQPGGRTDPRAAMRIALQMRPDTIYFLSDGAFDFSIARDLAKLSQKKIEIHTIALGNREGEVTLRKLAESNGGTYRYVP